MRLDDQLRVKNALINTNYRRIQWILMVIFIVESIFLFTIERQRFLSSVGDDFELVRVSYLLHLTLAIFSVITMMALYYLKRYLKEHTYWLERIPILTVGIVLLITATINVFDQMTTGHIVVFTAQMLLFGLLIYIKPPYQWGLFGLPYLVFMSGVIFFQENIDLLMTHVLNSGVVFIAMVVVTKRFYVHKVYDLHYNYTLKKINKKLEALSTLDHLTKVPNRRYFLRQVQHEAAINRRYQTTASLILIDIDYFKKINDTFGHQAGDFVLVELAKLLSKNIRESDTVSRWGGEEFMLLLSHTDIDGAYVLAERLREMVENTVLLYENQPLKVTISGGITALSSAQDKGFEVSYELADQAVYEAKNKGRNQVVTKTNNEKKSD